MFYFKAGIVLDALSLSLGEDGNMSSSPTFSVKLNYYELVNPFAIHARIHIFLNVSFANISRA